MEASSKVGDLAAKFRGSLAATSTTAGIVAGILGAWLTGHWLWGPFCGLLALIAYVAVAEALKARHEADGKSALAANSPALGGAYTSFSYTGDTHRYGNNASVGNITIAGGNIDDHRRVTTIKVGGLSLVALLALAGVAAGTIYLARSPGIAAEGGHNSPEAAVRGFFGDALLNNWRGACGYQLPSEQGTCNVGVSMGTAPQETGSVVAGNAIVDGTLALVPITGRLCNNGQCRTFSGNGLPSGATFQSAYAQAMNSANTTANLVPCEEVDNEWYIAAPNS
jgi:hypothetical protein